MTLYTAVITRGDFAISCLLNAFTFYPYMIILSPKKKLQRCPKDHHQPLRIRLRSTRLPIRVRILYILQLNFRCHRGWMERRNQTNQRIDAHHNASSSKIMPNIATLFKATTPEKFTGAEVVFFHIHCRAQHPFRCCRPFYIPIKAREILKSESVQPMTLTSSMSPFPKKNMYISPVTKTNDNLQSYNSF